MAQSKQWAAIGVVLIFTGLLAGCSTSTNVKSTSAKNNAASNTAAVIRSSNNTATAGLSTGNSSETSSQPNSQYPANSSNSTGTPSGSISSNTVAGSSGQTAGALGNTANLTLENILVGGGAYPGITLVVTHGDMVNEYTNAHVVTTGTQRQFLITLKNINPGKYPIGKPVSLNTKNIPSVEISNQGGNLVLTFDISKNYQSAVVGPAGGSEIGVLLQK